MIVALVALGLLPSIVIASYVALGVGLVLHRLIR